MDELMTNPEADVKDRELGTKPVKSLYARYSFVTLVGMIAQCVMVMFEGVIIGRGLGTLGLATVSIIMPLENLSLALGGFFGVGISSIAAIKLGDNDHEGARKVFAQGFWFCTIFMIVLSILIFTNVGRVAGFLGATSQITGDVVKFIKIFMIGYPFCVIGQMLCYVLRVDEKPGIASFFMSFASIVALAELFLSVVVFKIGITGAAIYYALSIGLWFGCIYYFLLDKNTLFKIKVSDLKIDFTNIAAALKTGIPFFIIQAGTFIFGIVINNMLGKLGNEVDIAAFSIINGYVIYILMMICNAMLGGVQPIASYNYGAKNKSRLKELIKVSVSSNFIIVMILVIITEIFAKPIISAFAGNNAGLVNSATLYTRIVVSFAAFGFTSNLISGYYQAVDKVAVSTVIGISRYVLFAIPLIFILVKPFGMMGIWYSQPVADILACLLSLILLAREIKSINSLG
ncbi:MATE family efflux transporter [Clostridium sp. 001]|uniref:MATE family efflux transporter n=1 Tax=Clostridium sp. 001 TaxID=1970093 RepID=UPI001C795BDB|nr:MATE family efflux transporter [Clostridium sp. 001]QXE18062.1 multidrug transporter MatE [Clostridium sp. 001]